MRKPVQVRNFSRLRDLDTRGRRGTEGSLGWGRGLLRRPRFQVFVLLDLENIPGLLVTKVLQATKPVFPLLLFSRQLEAEFQDLVVKLLRLGDGSVHPLEVRSQGALPVITKTLLTLQLLAGDPARDPLAGTGIAGTHTKGTAPETTISDEMATGSAVGRTGHDALFRKESPLRD
jgi:hypothetical protein